MTLWLAGYDRLDKHGDSSGAMTRPIASRPRSRRALSSTSLRKDSNPPTVPPLTFPEISWSGPPLVLIASCMRELSYWSCMTASRAESVPSTSDWPLPTSTFTLPSFWRMVVNDHSFVNGGNSFNEKLRNAGTVILGYNLAHLPTQLEPAKYERMVFGAILILMMIFRPQGILPARRRERELGDK